MIVIIKAKGKGEGDRHLSTGVRAGPWQREVWVFSALRSSNHLFSSEKVRETQLDGDFIVRYVQQRLGTGRVVPE